MIEAFYLQDGGPELLVVYHPPGNAAVDEITIICPPFFGDYMRVHLSLRELAISLASAGQHVMRFDYRSSGDSFGEPADVTLTNWAVDLGRVIDEARDVTGAQTINIVGVRAGAMVVARALGDVRDIGRIALWDPVFDGASYLDELQALQAASNQSNRWMRRADRVVDPDDIFGNVVTAAFRAEARAMTAHDSQSLAAYSCVAVCSDETHEQQCQSLPTRVVTFDCNWRTNDDAVLMPQPILEALQACVLSR